MLANDLIKQYLTPKGLAVWYMGDGTAPVKGGVFTGIIKFCTNCFKYEELEILVIILRDKFGLEFSIKSTSIAEQYTINLSVTSLDKFRGIVLPYMLPSFMYKLGLKPDGVTELPHPPRKYKSDE